MKLEGTISKGVRTVHLVEGRKYCSCAGFADGWGEEMESSGQIHAPAVLDREETSVPTTYSVFSRSERYEEEITISI